MLVGCGWGINVVIPSINWSLIHLELSVKFFVVVIHNFKTRKQICLLDELGIYFRILNKISIYSLEVRHENHWNELIFLYFCF